MIVKEIFYGVECDRCKTLYDGGDTSFWTDEELALEDTFLSEWIEFKGKHYCEECYDPDTKEPYEDYPEHIKQSINFVEKVIREYVNVVETDDYFILKVPIWDNKVTPTHISCLKALMNGKDFEMTLKRDVETGFRKVIFKVVK